MPMIKFEGVYMFGGVFGDSEASRVLNDQVYFLALGQGEEHRWKILKTSGKPPEGRFHHGMHFYEKGNYLIVFGGRRFANHNPNQIPQSLFVSSISLLRLDSVEWFDVKYKHEN